MTRYLVEYGTVQVGDRLLRYDGGTQEVWPDHEMVGLEDWIVIEDQLSGDDL